MKGYGHTNSWIAVERGVSVMQVVILRQTNKTVPYEVTAEVFSWASEGIRDGLFKTAIFDYIN